MKLPPIRTGPARAGTLASLLAGLVALLASTGLYAAAEVHAAEVAQGDVGKAGYEAYCQSCHQPDGAGMAGVFPPLADSDYLLDAERVIAYCGGGISATIDAMACLLIGKNEVAVYDGSMSEWVRDETLPMTAGSSTG